MGKSAFKLKSGNISGGSSFKMMGSSPAPQMEGSSPMQQPWPMKLAKKAKDAYNWWKYGDDVVSTVTKKQATENLKKAATQDFKLTKSGNINKSTKNYKNLTKATDELFEAGVSSAPIPATTTRYKIGKAFPWLLGGGIIGTNMAKSEADKTVIPYNTDHNPNLKRTDLDSNKTIKIHE